MSEDFKEEFGESEILEIEVPDLEEKDSYIQLYEHLLAQYRQALSDSVVQDNTLNESPVATFEHYLDRYATALRVDERKRADRDNEIGQLNQLYLTDEQIATAHMNLEQIEKWRKENPDKVD